MTCLSLKRTILRSIFITVSTLMLASCASSPNQSQTPEQAALTQSTAKLTTLFSELSQATNYLQTITPITACRFEIATHWNSESQGFYRAKHSQRFSFKHDLRAVDHSPHHITKFDGVEQQSQEKLQLTYNRLVPYQFSYYDNKTFEYRQNKGSDDQFSLIGFSKAPLTLMKAIEATLVDIAAQCGNDLYQKDSINQKIIGHWDISDQQQSIGELTVYPQEVILEQQQQTIRGPYQISHEGDYFRLTIEPENTQNQSVALDFINSNYARLILLDNENQAINFSALNQSPEENSTQLNLFRIGDLL